MTDNENLICPVCKLEVPRENFLIMHWLEATGKYWCPECGHEWGDEKKTGGDAL